MILRGNRSARRSAAKGFTLIETLIYIAVIGLVVSSFVVFSVSVSQSGNKTFVTQEVHANARHALDIMSGRIRASTGVNTEASTFGSDPGVLSLSMAASGSNPTVLSLSGDDGVLQITEGVGSAVALTSDEVKVTNLVFTNLTPTGARESIRIQMTVAYNNAGSDVEYSYSKSFQTAVSLRQ